jgi:hypothetical protein
MSAEDTITLEELRAATGSFGLADGLWDDIMRRREQYEPGEVYQDADGIKWEYDPACTIPREGSWRECPWLRPGIAGPAAWVAPKRPLRKLVPEGSPVSREQVLRAIHTCGVAASRDAGSVLADSVMSLLRGEQP